jgi:G6PDH family F420-dependent oxidoreductase
VIVSAFGSSSAELAADLGDGLWITGAAGDTVEAYRAAGGEGPIYSQLTLCWATDRDQAVETAHRLWAFTALTGQLNQDLATVQHFEEAVELVTPEMVAEQVPCGPDPEPVVKAARAAIEAGVDHLYFHQVGPDQEGFIDLWKSSLRDEVLS